MTFRLKPVAEIALMTAVSAVLFAQFFLLNDWLFKGLEHVKGVNWIFLPAGFRVLLVLVMGLPGALGIMLATCWLDRATFDLELFWLPIVTGLISGFTPLCIKLILEKRRILAAQLQNLTASGLLRFVLFYAAANALAHEMLWFFAKSRTDIVPWIDVWPMFVGDAIGALAILYALKLALPLLLRHLPAHKH